VDSVIGWSARREAENERIRQVLDLIPLMRWHYRHGWHESARGNLVLRKWHGQPYRDGIQYRQTRRHNARIVAAAGAYGSKLGRSNWISLKATDAEDIPNYRCFGTTWTGAGSDE
jgi:hypothetical protein